MNLAVIMRHSDISKFIVFICLLFTAGPFTGCKEQRQDSGRFAGLEPVTIGVASLVLSAPIIIAQEKGYFADEGLKVTLKEYQFGKLALEAALAGEVDLATVAETPIVMYSFERNDFDVIAAFVHSYDDSKIIVRTDRGIRTAEGLKGKRIATTFGTSAHFFLEIYLDYTRVDKSDVILIDIPQKNLADALNRGEVDAISAFEPHAYEALRSIPDKSMRLPRTELFRETFNLAAMSEFTKKHPAAIRKVLRAIDSAVAFIKQNKEASIGILAEKLNVDKKYLYVTWRDFEFGLSLDQTLLLTFEDVAEWAIQNELTDRTKVPNYLRLIYFDGLKSVKPEAVRILQ